MTDTRTLTLQQEHDVQNCVVVAQAGKSFGQVQQSLGAPKVANDVAFRGSDFIDLERGHGGDRQETFDLREYLASSNHANSAAGINHKHVGVTWEDLQVSGIGGEENKVRHFMNHPPHFLSHGL